MTGTDPRPPEPPSIPGHEYVGPLGSGGYSTVYLYDQLKPRRQVAVKVLRDFGRDEAALQQFADEADTMAVLGKHKHVVSVLTSGVAADGQAYLTMDYYPLPSLAKRVAAGPLPVAEVVAVGIDIADAVAAAHAAGIVHRDIKPANILTDEYGGYLLTDFGIAGRVVPLENDLDFGVSVPWSPPEILKGEPGGVASDLYSLGATLWHLLVGYSPFERPDGDNRRSALERRILTETAAEVSRPDVPAQLTSLLAEMLRHRPADRPESATRVLEALRRARRHIEPLSETQRRSVPSAARPVPAPLPPELTVTTVRGDAVSAARARGPAVAERPAVGTTSPDGDKTRPRVVAEVVEEAPARPGPASVRTHRGAWIAAVALVAAVGVGTAIALAAHSGGASTPPVTPATDDGQGAGVLGEDTPPGTPTVTATRISPTRLRFTWTYSAPLANDTFRWQTEDGKRSDVATTSSVELADPSGTRLCVQVKVVRADGSNAAVAWSPVGCGS